MQDKLLQHTKKYAVIMFPDPIIIIPLFLSLNTKKKKKTGTGLPGLNQYYARILCVLLKDHAVSPGRLEPAASRSRVKHSTTEPLRSLPARL